jgi:hypothetical protein
MAYSNVMDYVTIGTAGNATDFGNLTAASDKNPTACSIVRGLIFGGRNRTAVIDYITIASTGNAADFGDHVNGDNFEEGYAVHNKLYAYFGRRDVGQKEKHTIATAANATVFNFTSQNGFGQADSHATIKGWIAASG